MGNTQSVLQERKIAGLLACLLALEVIQWHVIAGDR